MGEAARAVQVERQPGCGQGVGGGGQALAARRAVHGHAGQVQDAGRGRVAELEAAARRRPGSPGRAVLASAEANVPTLAVTVTRAPAGPVTAIVSSELPSASRFGAAAAEGDAAGSRCGRADGPDRQAIEHPIGIAALVAELHAQLPVLDVGPEALAGPLAGGGGDVGQLDRALGLDLDAVAGVEGVAAGDGDPVATAGHVHFERVRILAPMAVAAQVGRAPLRRRGRTRPGRRSRR